MCSIEGFFEKKCYIKGFQLSVVVSIILAFMVLVPMVATAENQNPGVLPVNSKPYGNTYGEWTAMFWQLAYSIPEPCNPILDTTGEFCNEGQSGKVWFLPGTFGNTGITRECMVPAGKAILIPVINAECSEIEGDSNNEDDLRGCANWLIDHVTEIEMTVDGREIQDLENYRVESPLFEFTLPDNNILGIQGGGSSLSVSDGYWVMLAPLSAGEHEIYIYGKAEFPEFIFETEVTYNLQVRSRNFLPE
jgi:hypothetical protein